MHAGCAQCGAPVRRHERGSVNKTCSAACANAGRAAKARGRRPSTYRGRTTTSSGYIYVDARGHPAAGRNGYVLEHRLVMELVLGRLLHGTERVHHKNGVRSDNRPENLEVWVLGAKDPQGARTRDLWREIERRLSDTPTKNEVREAFEQVFGFGNRSQQSASAQRPYAGHSIAALPGRDRATEEQRRVAATPTGRGSHRHQGSETD